ncbi:MAG TPA: FAD-dependent oxidoreductase [Bryobacteraceae bacterium]|nr:FAD-dependent oxidoreductase [Bryobacteraceae bacterium]
MDAFRYVILGGGMVAGYAAKEFVERGIGKGELAIVSADDALPYERPPLSKGYLRGTDAEESVFIGDAAFYSEHGIEVKLRTRVERADFGSRTLYLAGGGEWRYEKLLVATGARVRTLDVPGANLDGLYYLRSLSDSRRIRERAAKAKRAVVIGGGFIGMEAAASLRVQGMEITMLLVEERVWPRLFTAEVSTFFERYYEARGIRILRSATLKGLVGSERVEGVDTGPGGVVPADMVVAGIGVIPETDLFESAGLRVQNGIPVNEYLETEVPGVWAAGDVANYRDVLYSKARRVEHWDNAVSQGRHAARTMTGTREWFAHVPYFFSDVFDLSYEFWGDASEGTRTVTRGDVRSGSFSLWWLKERRLMAAFVLARPDEERELAQKWLAERTSVSAEKLADSARPLPV